MTLPLAVFCMAVYGAVRFACQINPGHQYDHSNISVAIKIVSTLMKCFFKKKIPAIESFLLIIQGTIHVTALGIIHRMAMNAMTSLPCWRELGQH